MTSQPTYVIDLPGPFVEIKLSAEKCFCCGQNLPEKGQVENDACLSCGSYEFEATLIVPERRMCGVFAKR